MSTLTYHSPAKINLYLAITGRRPDSFHNLVSVVAPLEWGDTLQVHAADEFSLTCSDPTLPVDASNLVIKAAMAFRAATGSRIGAAFSLEKRIPMGAGLGGGSSNAAMALRALNHLAGEPLDFAALSAVAATVGSDCPLFLHPSSIIMRGRGELIEPLPRDAVERMRGQHVLVFKPAFSISTPWAYRELAKEAPAGYVAPEEAEKRLAEWTTGRRQLGDLLFNNLERPAFRKFPALPILHDRLAKQFGLAPRMSGSGSACFAFLKPEAPVTAIATAIRDAWGESAFLLQTRLA